jgi:hypothetical protein
LLALDPVDDALVELGATAWWLRDRPHQFARPLLRRELISCALGTPPLLDVDLVAQLVRLLAAPGKVLLQHPAEIVHGFDDTVYR